MQEQTEMLVYLMETSGVLAPIAFIVLHLIRPFLFIPMIIVCLAGGYLFGTVYGSFFSLLGLTIASLVNYHIFDMFPGIRHRFYQMKRRRISPYIQLTTGQIAVLKLFPVMNFQLLNLLLMERRNNFSSYAMNSLLTNIPAAFFYSFLGRSLHFLTWVNAVVFFFVLFILMFILRQRFVIIKWKDFFGF